MLLVWWLGRSRLFSDLWACASRVELWSKFNQSSDGGLELNTRLARNRADVTKIVTELRSGSNLNSIKAWSSLVQQGLILLTLHTVCLDDVTNRCTVGDVYVGDYVYLLNGLGSSMDPCDTPDIQCTYELFHCQKTTHKLSNTNLMQVTL